MSAESSCKTDKNIEMDRVLIPSYGPITTRREIDNHSKGYSQIRGGLAPNANDIWHLIV